MFRSRPDLQGVKTDRLPKEPSPAGVPKQTRSSGGQNVSGVVTAAAAEGFRSRPDLQGVKTPGAGRLGIGETVFRSRPDLQGVKTARIAAQRSVVPSFRSRPDLQGVKTRRRAAGCRGCRCSEADPIFRGSKRRDWTRRADRYVAEQARSSGGPNGPARRRAGPTGSEADPIFRGSKPLTALHRP